MDVLSSWNGSDLNAIEDMIDNMSYINESKSYNDDYFYGQPIFMKNPEDMLKPWIMNPLFFHIVITHSAAFIFGLFGNVVVMSVMVGDRKARNATNLFLVSLSAADLLLLLICSPLETLRYFVVQWDEGGAICKMSVYVELLSAIASVLNLAAVTVERFVVIVFPMKSRSLCTIKNCRRAIVTVWFIAIILSIPVLLTKKSFPVVVTNNITNLTLHYCNETEETGIIAIYEFLVLFAGPGTLMVLCYTYVIRELWRSTRNMQMLTNSVSVKKSKCQNGPSEESLKEVQVNYGESQQKVSHNSNKISKKHKGEDARKARKQVIKMLILVVILFLICWGPRIILQVIIKHNLHTFTQTTYAFKVTFDLLPYIHACMNPFIYSFMSKNFRRALQRQLEKLGCKKKTRTGSSRMAIASSTRISKSQRSTPPMHRSWRGFRFMAGRPSTSSTTNYLTDLTKQTDIDPGAVPLQPTTSAV